MEISTIEKTLIGYLKTSKASKGKGAIVFLMLDTEEQMLKMCQYLSKNPDATEQSILAEAEKIVRTV